VQRISEIQALIECMLKVSQANVALPLCLTPMGGGRLRPASGRSVAIDAELRQAQALEVVVRQQVQAAAPRSASGHLPCLYRPAGLARPGLQTLPAPDIGKAATKSTLRGHL
jgi:hypothetical protein